MSRKDIAKDRKNFNPLQFFSLWTFLSSIDCSTLGANVTFLEKRHLYRSNVLCYLQSSVILFVLCSKNNTANNIRRNEIEFWRKHQPSKNSLVLKTSWRHVLKTSSTRLQGNNFTSSKTSWRHLARRLQDMSRRRLEDMSWRCLEDMSWRRLEDMSWRHLEDIIETSKILTGDICILI